MVRGRPRKTDPESALDSAMMLFWKKGFEATSMSDLSEATGMAKPGLYATFGDKEALNDATLNLGRCVTILIAAIAAIGAVAVNSIVSGLLVCYTIWAPAILPALIIGLWIKRPHPLAGILSMGVGTIVAVVFEFIYPAAINIPAIIPALAAGLLAYALGHWMEKTKFGA